MCTETPLYDVFVRDSTHKNNGIRSSSISRSHTSFMKVAGLEAFVI